MSETQLAGAPSARIGRHRAWAPGRLRDVGAARRMAMASPARCLRRIGGDAAGAFAQIMAAVLIAVRPGASPAQGGRGGGCGV
ncbi:MAG: hypothetical protein D1H97_17775 [Paracoccus sp. BP8]|nr:MAG: hypothetical protein D1H97_17775 [Paracoccus sp. BP8]